jgi:hypothetical protein
LSLKWCESKVQERRFSLSHGEKEVVSKILEYFRNQMVEPVMAKPPVAVET